MAPCVLCVLCVLGALAAVSSGDAGRRASAPAQPTGTYTTIVYNDDAGYATGACVLAQTLRETGTTRPLVAIVTPLVAHATRAMLRAAGWALREVDAIVDPQRPASHIWHYCMTKLEVWRLPYARVVYLDADTVVVGNTTLDNLFACGEFCAVADPSPSDTFNSGVMVATPAAATYAALVALVTAMPPGSFADQALLNRHFGYHALPAAARLPAAYNVPLPIYADFRPTLGEVRVLHYTAALKPWKWWTAALSVSNGPWNAARQRLGVHCRSVEGCDEAALGNVDAPFWLFLVSAALVIAIYAPHSAGTVYNGWVMVIAAVAAFVYGIAAGGWRFTVYALVAIVINVYVFGDASPVATPRGVAMRIVRVVTVIIAAPVALVVAVAVLPANANAVAAHAAVFALYAVLVVACVASPLPVLVLPIIVYPVALAVAYWLSVAGIASAGLVAIIVSTALAATMVVCHGVVAWVATGRGADAKLKM